MPIVYGPYIAQNPSVHIVVFKPCVIKTLDRPSSSCLNAQLEKIVVIARQILYSYVNQFHLS